jgi:hypothetical protein
MNGLDSAKKRWEPRLSGVRGGSYAMLEVVGVQVRSGVRSPSRPQQDFVSRSSVRLISQIHVNSRQFI